MLIIVWIVDTFLTFTRDIRDIKHDKQLAQINAVRFMNWILKFMAVYNT
jgi:hypothetical protein